MRYFEGDDIKKYLRLWLGWSLFDLAWRASGFFGASSKFIFGVFGDDIIFLYIGIVISSILTGGLYSLVHIAVVAIWRKYDRITSSIVILIILVMVVAWSMPTTNFTITPDEQFRRNLGFSLLLLILAGLILMMRTLGRYVWRKIRGETADK
jgi:hypothetical protein